MRQVQINRSFLAGAGALALALAGCGSSSSSSSTSTSASASTTASHSTASVMVAHPHTIPGVAAPAGALPAAKAKLSKLHPVAKGSGVHAH
ncbi:MAG: hypothetical protein M3Z16_01875, partial [Pseudomonadota bacterium]|nr:hypothetical protein [Pseudomonadota bacterium]